MKYIISIAAIIQAIIYIRKVYIKKPRTVILVYSIIIYNMVIKFLVGNLGLPSMLNYVSDLLLVWLIMEFLYQRKGKLSAIPKSLLFWATILLICTILSYACNQYSPLLYLWGFRNNFRFVLFAMMCAVYLQRDDIDTIMDILYGFFLTNIIVVTYQAFFVNFHANAVGDFISGLYSNGMERGGNASLDWLMCIVCTYETVKYLNQCGCFQKLAICWLGSIYMAALGEIKLFFLQTVIIALLAVLICKKSRRAFTFGAIAVVSLFFGIQFLYFMFPKFADFFTYENILSYVSSTAGYSSRGHAAGINRLTAISFVFTHFLHSFPERLFGIGLGNADFSGFDFLISDFYRRYSWTAYQFFSSSFVLVELGIMGFSAYLLYFYNYLRKAMSFSLRTAKEKSVGHTVAIIAIMTILMIFSNQTMKMETSAYMVVFLLSSIFAVQKTDDNTPVTDKPHIRIKYKKIRIRRRHATQNLGYCSRL